MKGITVLGKVLVGLIFLMAGVGLLFTMGDLGLDLMDHVQRGDIGSVLFALVGLAAILGIFLFGFWVADNAPKAARELKQACFRKPAPNGDLGPVVGIPQREPWLG